jgi:hypothetical protein
MRAKILERQAHPLLARCRGQEVLPAHFTYRQIFSCSKDHFDWIPETRHDLLPARIPYRLLSGVT